MDTFQKELARKIKQKVDSISLEQMNSAARIVCFSEASGYLDGETCETLKLAMIILIAIRKEDLELLSGKKEAQ